VQVERVPGEGAAQHRDLAARAVRAGGELFGDVVDDPVGRGRRAGEDRHRGGARADQLVEDVAQAAVVGPEVVAVVGDAVRLVDHEHADPGDEAVEDLPAEAGVVEPFGRHQQQVDRPRRPRPRPPPSRRRWWS
jgi:hypothetical protein